MRESSQGGSPSSIGAQFEQKGAELIKTSSKNKGGQILKGEFGDIVTETMKNIDKVRGGRGSIGDPAEISAALKEAHKIEDHAEHLIAKLKNDKEGLLFIIADLKIKEKQVIESGRKGEAEALRIKIAKEQKEIDKINGALPERNISEDQKYVQQIITEWHDGKRDWTKELAQFAKAEKKLETKPEDGHVQGFANRARTEKVATEELLNKVGNEAEQLTENSKSHPAENESVSLTHVEALAQHKEWLEHHKRAQEESVLEAVPAEEPAEIETTSAEVAPAQLEQPSEKTSEHLTSIGIENRQTEAYENFGEKHTPEEHDAIPPILTEEVVETVGVPQEGQEAAFEKFELSVETRSKLGPEQLELFERVATGVENAEGDTVERGIKANASKYLDNAGTEWNKLPLRYKFLLSGAMIATGATFGAAAAVPLVAVGAFLRVLGGLGIFVSTKQKLNYEAMKKSGAELTKKEETRNAVFAGVLSMVVAGLLPGVVRDYVVSPALEKLNDLFGGHTAHAETMPAQPSEIEQGQANLAALDHVSEPNPDLVLTAEAGDSRWSLAERALAEGPYKDQFSAITSDEQRTYIIDALKDKLTEGMTPEQANSLNIGDEINFKEHFADTDFMKETFSDAQNLSPEEIANIHNYENTAVAEIATETPERMVSASQLLGQPLITDFAPPQTASTGAIPQEVIPDADKDIVMGGSKVPTMPQEILPSDPQVLAYADQQVHTHITTLFGSKGFLGIGAVDGMKTANWLDFANRPVEEVMSAKPNVFPESGEVRIGMENNESLSKMKEYLKAAFEGTGVQLEPGETVEKYLKRAAGMAIGKFMNKG